MSDANKLSEKEIRRRREASLKAKQALSKQHAPDGKMNRAESHKGNKVQPAKQRNSLQKGR